MSGQDAFERILASLYDAMLDDALWPGTSVLIVAVNDRGRRILQDANGVSDGNGALRSRAPDDELRLQRTLAAALSTSGAVPVGGSMLVGRVCELSPFVVHVKPVGAPQPDYGARHVAALVLIVEPRRQRRVDPALVETTLTLTQVAVWLAEGRSAARWPRPRGSPEAPSVST